MLFLIAQIKRFGTLNATQKTAAPFAHHAPEPYHALVACHSLMARHAVHHGPLTRNAVHHAPVAHHPDVHPTVYRADHAPMVHHTEPYYVPVVHHNPYMERSLKVSESSLKVTLNKRSLQGTNATRSSNTSLVAESLEEDRRDINQLLEFIHRDDSKVQDNHQDDGALPQKERAFEAKALQGQQHTKDAQNVCFDNLNSDTVGGCKKKVNKKQRTTDGEMKIPKADKEAMLEDMRCHAKEMRKLITGFEKAEDYKAAKLKEVAEIDARGSKEDLQITRARLLVECDAKDMVMKKLTKKRKKLEEFLDNQIEKYKSETSRNETDDSELKQLEQIEKEVSYEVNTIKITNLQLLDHIDRKIEVKERELECPICLEVAAVPIFMCDESHHICSSCRPKVQGETSTLSPPCF